MTREQTVALVRSVVDLYQNWKPSNLTETVNAWNWALEDFPADAVKNALRIYLRTNDTGFAPSVSQLIACMYKSTDNERMTEGEAWSMVKKAIQDGNYHSAERYAELPEIVQKAVGNAEMIHQWAQTGSDEVNTVIMSNFQRTFRALTEREKFNEKIPTAIAMKATPGIGVNDEA